MGRLFASRCASMAVSVAQEVAIALKNEKRLEAMSRIGKKPIVVPAGVTVTIDGPAVNVKGKKGELHQTFNADLTIQQEGNIVTVIRPSDERHHRALHGLTRALLQNMVTGVSDGFSRVLEIEGVGYRAELQGKNLVLHVGYSHSITVEPSATIAFAVDADSKGRKITVSGIDKQEVGEVAAFIRKQRPPEPYLGTGIRYQGEVIIRKAGKAGKTGKK